MPDNVNISVSVPLSFRPWAPPGQAIVVNGDGTESHAVPLKELDAVAVDALADAWLRALYSEAGKPCPFRKIGFRGA